MDSCNGRRACLALRRQSDRLRARRTFGDGAALLVSACAAFVAFTVSGSVQAHESVAEVDDAATRIAERTNAFRLANGLQPVAPSPELQDAARAFARFMSDTGKYGHDADGRRPAQRATAHGYEHCIVSENIALVQRSTGYETSTLADEMFTGWENSAAHRENMVEPAVTQIGVGVARDERGRYFGVQMFGRPESAAIRFSVRNAAGQTIAYRTGERRYSLAPRAVRTHTICMPTTIEIESATPVRERAEDGAGYTVVHHDAGLAVTRE